MRRSSTGSDQQRRRGRTGSLPSTSGAEGQPALRGTARPLPLLYALAALAYASFGAFFQVLPPFFDDLERQFGVGRTLTGLSMTAVLAPLALTAPLIGAASDRYGPSRVARLGFALLLGGGIATAAAPTFALLLASRALAGLGGGMVLVGALKLLAAAVPAERLGTAFGVFVAGLPIGTGIAFNGLSRVPSWRLAAAGAVVLVALAGLAVALLVPPEQALRRGGSLRDDLKAALAPPALRQLTVLVALGYAAIVAFTTWAPTRLAAYGGFASGTATLIASLLLLIDIPFAPLWGRLSDHAGRRKPFIVVSFLVYAAGAFLVPVAARAGAALALVVVSAMGVGCAMFFPATLAVPRVHVPERLLGVSYGLFLTAQALGMALGPLALGAVFEAGSTPAGLFVIGALAAAAFAASLRLPTR